MKLLFCSQHPLDRRLGAPKALMELAAELDRLGWRCTVASDKEICPAIPSRHDTRWSRAFAEALARFLDQKAKEFDVVDYDHRFLPFPRERFSSSALFVARVPLLLHHFETIRIPPLPSARARIASVVNRPLRLLDLKYNLRRANRCLQEADLINVSNDYDRIELLGRKFDTRKLAVLPLGLTRDRLASFAATAPIAPDPPRVAFVGTFDARKGAGDLPEIARLVVGAMPECKFRLLGSQYLGVEDVLRFFPPKLRSSLEIHPRFEPADLPNLLRDCSLGIFPSYVEGFGFAVLEMLAASLPVIAYDSPGPPMMLTRDYLVPRGNVVELASKVVSLLRNANKLVECRLWARRRAEDFTWERAAKLTSDVYSAHLTGLRSRSTYVSTEDGVKTL